MLLVCKSAHWIYISLPWVYRLQLCLDFHEVLVTQMHLIHHVLHILMVLLFLLSECLFLNLLLGICVRWWIRNHRDELISVSMGGCQRLLDGRCLPGWLQVDLREHTVGESQSWWLTLLSAVLGDSFHDVGVVAFEWICLFWLDTGWPGCRKTVDLWFEFRLGLISKENALFIGLIDEFLRVDSVLCHTEVLVWAWFDKVCRWDCIKDFLRWSGVSLDDHGISWSVVIELV